MGAWSSTAAGRAITVRTSSAASIEAVTLAYPMAGQLAREGPVHGADTVVDHEHLLQRTHKLERYSIRDGLER